MDQLFPNEGLVSQLYAILATTPVWRLYTNNVPPQLTTILALLFEGAWAGYAAVPQGAGNFTISGVAGNNGYAIAPPITFANTSGAPVTVYGYYVTDAANTMLLAIAQFDGAPLTIEDGDTLPVVPIWGDFSGLGS